jgi:RNA polymerase sigma-70 factor, ECF subfamily
MQAQRMPFDVETHARGYAAAGQYEHCFELAITSYGPELLGFLASLVGDEEAARELYAQLCADLWKALPHFEWRASFRTWAYASARHAAQRYRQRDRRARRFQPLSTGVHEIAASRDRVSTSPHLRTENKTKVRLLRDSLDPADREILTLRIDRELEWQEIAEILAGTSLSEAEGARRSAALRKRFERIKRQLRTLAEAAGMLDEQA